MTRWHEDDLAGRLLKAQELGCGETWRYVRLPALAEEEGDVLGRKPGEPLCPELIPTEQLLGLKNSIGEYAWATLYQQSPYPRGGGMFKTDQIEIVPPEALEGEQLDEPVRSWDFAASLAKSADRTAGIRLAYWPRRKRWIIQDALFGRWAPEERNRRILQCALADGFDIKILMELQPAAAGIDFSRSMTEMLSAWSVEHLKANGSKEVRADPCAGQVNIGRLMMVQADWNRDVLKELEAFPSGEHDDLVDALVQGYNHLARSPGGVLPHYSSDWDGKMRLQSDDHDSLNAWRLMQGTTLGDEPDINDSKYDGKEIV